VTFRNPSLHVAQYRHALVVSQPTGCLINKSTSARRGLAVRDLFSEQKKSKWACVQRLKTTGKELSRSVTFVTGVPRLSCDGAFQ
jgi:hypothetical protein